MPELGGAGMWPGAGLGDTQTVPGCPTTDFLFNVLQVGFEAAIVNFYYI